MKKGIFVLIFLLFVFPGVCYAIVEPTEDFYVNDYANILSDETEKYILKRSLALNEADGTQIVVVTIKSLENMSLENYANTVFNSFGIGKVGENNGLLLLLALDERAMRVEVGGGLGGILPDGKTGRFQDDYMIPYLKEDKWDEGIKNGYDAFYSEIVELRNLNVDYSKPIESYVNPYYKESSMLESLSMPLSFLLAGITGTNTKNAGGKKKQKYVTYIGLWFVGMLLSAIFRNVTFISALLFYLVFYLLFSLKDRVSGDGIYYSRRSNSRSRRSYSSGSRSSSRSFSGGGGRSSGGGSSRRF